MGISRLKNNKKEVIALFAIGLLFGSSCEGAATKSGLVKKVFCEFYDSNLNDVSPFYLVKFLMFLFCIDCLFLFIFQKIQSYSLTEVVVLEWKMEV